MSDPLGIVGAAVFFSFLLTANANSMAENAAATDTDEYFKAVEDGDLQKVKELLREKRVQVDIINKVFHIFSVL